MKALVKTAKGKGNIEVRQAPEPSPRAGQVKIEIAACGVCGSDIHVWHDTFPYWPPVILGHEFTGTVVERGPECSALSIGDRVVAEPHTKACGRCFLCRTGNIQICADKRSPGWGIDGGMAKYICYPERLLHRIPAGMSWEQAALVEPTANAVTDLILRTRMQAGDLVAVLGPGPIGLLCALVARAAGARDVVIIGTPADEELRLPAARDLGFSKIVNVGDRDPVEAVMEATRGVGADVVVECSGAPKAIAQSVDLVRKMGKICAIGLTGGKNVELAWDRFSFKVVELVFNLSTMYDSWDRAIELISRGLAPAEKLVTHKQPLDNWEQVFHDIENMKALKALLTP